MNNYLQGLKTERTNYNKHRLTAFFPAMTDRPLDDDDCKET